MYKVYFKQAIQLLKQNPFFSLIYILGTGLAIAMVMAITILYYLRTADIAPEVNRHRTLLIQHGVVATKEGRKCGSSQYAYSTIKACFYPMKTPEAVTAVIPVGLTDEFAQIPGNEEFYTPLVMATDASFWNVFRFHFISGHPYSPEEFTAGIRKAVLCESLAKEWFNTAEAQGKTIFLNYEEYTVAGVVKDAPAVANYCYAQVWIPFTTRPQAIEGGKWCDYLLGHMKVYILAKSSDDFDAIKQEAEAMCRRFNTTTAQYDLLLTGQPDTPFQAFFHTNSFTAPDYALVTLRCILILFILLLVPSVNLTGMTSSRMQKRLPELGIRKAFGGRNSWLLIQILYENLLLTLLGGVVGLVLSYGLIWGFRYWLLASYSWSGIPLAASIDLSPGMLLNPAIFCYAFMFCLLLNLLSALWPAWHALRKPVVCALNEK